jgi:hypothetical protein
MARYKNTSKDRRIICNNFWICLRFVLGIWRCSYRCFGEILSKFYLGIFWEWSIEVWVGFGELLEQKNRYILSITWHELQPPQHIKESPQTISNLLRFIKSQYKKPNEVKKLIKTLKSRQGQRVQPQRLWIANFPNKSKVELNGSSSAVFVLCFDQIWPLNVERLKREEEFELKGREWVQKSAKQSKYFKRPKVSCLN